VFHRRALDFGRANLPTGDVEGVVGAAVEIPEAILILLGPVAMVPEVLPRTPVLL